MKSRWSLSSGEWGGYSVAAILSWALAALDVTLVVPPFTVPLWPVPLLIGAFVFAVIHGPRGEAEEMSDAFFADPDAVAAEAEAADAVAAEAEADR